MIDTKLKAGGVRPGNWGSGLDCPTRLREGPKESKPAVGQRRKDTGVDAEPILPFQSPEEITFHAARHLI